MKQSKFVSYQEIKIQEPSDQVPTGHVPRQIDIVARGATSRQCSPGDIVNVVGVYMPSVATGFAWGRRDRLFHQPYVEAFNVQKDK